MSALDSVLDRLRRAHATASEVETTAARFPSDKYVLANLTALKRDVSKLEQQWEEECLQQGVEVCRYRLISEGSERFTVPSFTKSLLDFQELFSQVYDALKNGTKRRAVVSGLVVDETTFDFAFSYPGSLGVALTVQSEATLLDAKFDASIDAIMQIAAIDSEGEVKDFAKRLGDAVVKKVYDWSLINHVSGFSVDVTWNTARGQKKGGIVDVSTLGKIAEIISRTSDVESRTFKTRGLLVAIDTVKKKFRLVEPEGQDYFGSLSEDFPVSNQWSVNKAYTADISVSAVTKYATQTTDQSYRLLALTPVDI